MQSTGSGTQCSANDWSEGRQIPEIPQSDSVIALPTINSHISQKAMQKTQTASRKITAVLCICCGGSSFEDKEFFLIFCIPVLKATVSQNKQAPKYVHLRIDKIRTTLHKINTHKNKVLVINSTNA